KNHVLGRVSIVGTNFGTNAADIVVSFGGTQSPTINSINDNEIVCEVPAGATYDKVSVTRLSSQKTAYSPHDFTLSFGAENFSISNFGAQQKFTSGDGLIDLCACDFDGDGLADVIGANNNTNLFGILRNISTPTLIDFDESNFNLNSPVTSASCGDLDGDGKPDLVFSKSGTNTNRVLVLRNNSTLGNISFEAAKFFNTSGSNTRKIAINDLDKDGKPDLIVTNESNNQLSILKNTTVGSNISFASSLALSANGASNTGAIALVDLNNDSFTDIIASTVIGSDLYVFINNSAGGTLNFSESNLVDLPGNLVNIKVGDLNNDMLPEIIATQFLNDQISIVPNTSSGDNISFGTPININVIDRPWGVDLGDINGDRKLDILVGSTSNDNQIGLLINTSTTGSPTFALNTLNTSEPNRNVKFVDVSGEGKPDIVFTSSDGNISVFRNTNCLEAIITPGNDIVACVGQNIRLSTPAGTDATYQWTKDGANFATTPSINVTVSGAYEVTTTSSAGTCISTSNTINVTINPGTIPAKPSGSSNSPVCGGETLNLSANATNATSYFWSGPNGFTSTLQNPDITNVSSAAAGKYTVFGINGDCTGEPEFIFVDIQNTPSVEITSDEPLEFCAGDDATLIIEQLNAGTGATYQWLENGSPIAGANSNEYDATSAGNYSLRVTNTNGCSTVSNVLTTLSLTPPIAEFSVANTACVGTDISFTNTSQVDPSATATYSWDFNDGNTSSEISPVHVYNTASTFNVGLTVSYGSCSDVFNQTVEVNPAITVEIERDETSVCEGDSIRLSATSGYESYSWSSGQTDSVIFVTTSGTYTVDVSNSSGCTASASMDATINPLPSLTIVASDTLLTLGDSTILTASGAETYLWSPSLSLSDSAGNIVIAKPDSPTTYNVIGTDSNGCQARSAIRILVTRDEPDGIDISAPKLFSPNNDGIDDFWIIDGIENYPDCEVIIFNKTGRIVYQSQPYINDWNGLSEGQPLDQDVYYYVIRCSGDNAATGTVMIVR
ncbi:T9SS type B sorting domain-containing protein, partial [Fulvivirga sp. RKSG066]|uniref:FG-GAP-like repeat-containing protein n=1 Tax=Fulvivirga aurantia TaxID=2529383 RepID=UPI0012BD00D7